MIKRHLAAGWAYTLKILDNPLVNLVVAGAVGAIASLLVTWSTLGPSQDRQMRLESITSFSAGADEFLTLGTGIASRMAINSDLDETKLAIGSASARQVVGAEALIELFGPAVTDEARNYQSAITTFVSTTNQLHDPAEIRDWVMAFDGVVVAQRAFKSSLNEVLKVEPLGVSHS